MIYEIIENKRKFLGIITGITIIKSTEYYLVSDFDGLSFPVMENLLDPTIIDSDLSQTWEEFTVAGNKWIGEKDFVEKYYTDIIENEDFTQIARNKYLEKYRVHYYLKYDSRFENNPELYKLWKEDPEGFDDYLRGKQSSENK